jgi:putative membrane protein
MRITGLALLVPLFSLTPLGLSGCAHEGGARPQTVNEALPPPTGPDAVAFGEPHLPVAPDVADTGPSLAEPIPRPTATPPTEPLDDEKILEVTHVADTGEISQAKLAEMRAHDASVVRLAHSIDRDHSKTENETQRLERVSKFNPQGSALSGKLQDDAKRQQYALDHKVDGDFDRAYIDSVVSTQRNMLDLIDNKLLPNATDADVRALIEGLRPEVARHFEAARRLQLKLNK